MAGANLLVLGPPKCATSSLHRWLLAHPQIADGARKELFFLMDRGHPLVGNPNLLDDGEAAYADLFLDASLRASWRIDSTTHYLYQETALEFARARPGIRAIAVLRDPAERILSSFRYTQNNLANIVPDLSFSEFIAMVDGGKSLYPDKCRSASSAWVLDHDIQMSHYAPYLESWRESLRDDQFKIVLFDDLRAAPEGTTDAVFQWLGVDRLAETSRDTARANKTHPIARQKLHRLALQVNAAIPFPRSIKDRLKSTYYRAQASGATAAKLSRADREVLAGLRHRFDSDIAAVEAATNRNLDHWRTGRVDAK